MGRATIVSGGPDGRYVIELDYGQAYKTAVLAAFGAAMNRFDEAIAKQQEEVDKAALKEKQQRDRYLAEVDAFAIEHATFHAGSPRPSDAAVKFELQKLRKLEVEHEPLREALRALKFDRAHVLRQIAYWNGLSSTETRPAWCADFTETASPGASVATIDIPGDSNLLLIAPGARAPAVGDGALVMREMMSPEQAYLNAAIFPGWQKYKPTYRWGTLTAIDTGTHTCSVNLHSAVSSAQRLPVNQSSSLVNVPIDYMGCNSIAFEVGDRVVVQFVGQSWQQPRVIGFLDNPRPCSWELTNCYATIFTFASLSTEVLAEVLSGATFDVRYCGGSGGWVQMSNFAEGYDPDSPNGDPEQRYDDTADSVQRTAFYQRRVDSELTSVDKGYFYAEISPGPPALYEPSFVRNVLRIRAFRNETSWSIQSGIRVEVSANWSADVRFNPGWTAYPRNSFEFRIHKGGVLLFNGAFDDPQPENWSAQAIDLDLLRRVNVNTAIKLRDFVANSVAFPSAPVVNTLPFPLGGLG